MAYTLPVMTVPIDVWYAGKLPDDDAPDQENVNVQFYVYSRVSFDVQPCELELYQPPIQIRMSLSTLSIWELGQVFEVPAESGRYYRARLKERVHLGFPNEYLVVYVVQCNGAGLAVARDIENAEPCGGGLSGEGESALSITLTPDGEGTVTTPTPPPDIVGGGTDGLNVELDPTGFGTIS